ncbi:Aste57867_18748 [Aphanomyces stellatus]|uniref:Aste57867_18748 protein n=1 Tax=Aphanomyces stellatus TaxID=120398 RepID=A0A485LAW4_9STRA|nr:hypothetical protein As57867_018684 [Aphanomyces stellatus]VFT95482.1 Aste57867_18748 [Aphanomyces stellatus]
MADTSPSMPWPAAADASDANPADGSNEEEEETPFNTLRFDETDDDSEYAPSEASDVASDDDDAVGGDDGGLVDGDVPDERFWATEKDKLQWTIRYERISSTWQRKYGCRIDSDARPEVSEKLRRERRWRRVQQVFVCLVTLAYAAQWWAVLNDYNIERMLAPVRRVWPRHDPTGDIAPPLIDSVAPVESASHEHDAVVDKEVPPVEIDPVSDDVGSQTIVGELATDDQVDASVDVVELDGLVHHADDVITDLASHGDDVITTKDDEPLDEGSSLLPLEVDDSQEAQIDVDDAQDIPTDDVTSTEHKDDPIVEIDQDVPSVDVTLHPTEPNEETSMDEAEMPELAIPEDAVEDDARTPSEAEYTVDDAIADEAFDSRDDVIQDNIVEDDDAIEVDVIKVPVNDDSEPVDKVDTLDDEQDPQAVDSVDDTTPLDIVHEYNVVDEATDAPSSEVDPTEDDSDPSLEAQIRACAGRVMALVRDKYPADGTAAAFAACDEAVAATVMTPALAQRALAWRGDLKNFLRDFAGASIDYNAAIAAHAGRRDTIRLKLRSSTWMDLYSRGHLDVLAADCRAFLRADDADASWRPSSLEAVATQWLDVVHVPHEDADQLKQRLFQVFVDTRKLTMMQVDPSAPPK